MDSSEDAPHYVDRREVVINPAPSSQINADKTPVGELAAIEVDVNANASIAESLGSTDDRVKTLRTFERSEVSVEIQGLRETTLSTSETVVNSRVRTVYSRSLSESTSSTELEHTESVLDSHQESEYPVFGENAYLDGEHRERKISDSFYISQTYQINTEERASTSQTTVKCVNFRSSKDFEVGSHENVSDEAALHFVDRMEEIIAGENPEAVGSPKEKHVRFLWYDTEQDDIETQRRMQSARESVQHLIESTYMVNDISDVVNDNCMGPESENLTQPTADNFPAEGGPEFVTELDRQSNGMVQNVASVEASDLNILSRSSSLTTQVAYAQAQSAGDSAHFTSSKLFSSSEVTLAGVVDSHQVTAASIEKPTCFPNEFESADSLTTGRGSSRALAYSPGMAIRHYALEELEEKRYRITPDRSVAEAKSLRFDEESSGVDVDKGSSVDNITAQSTSDLSIISVESYASDSLSSQRFAVQTGKTPVQEMTREEEDESLDKLVDLESIQVGYRFHDVGVMQAYGGICNLAFDDTDELETASSLEDRTSTLQPQGAVNIGMSVAETASGGSSEVLSTSQLGTDKDSLTSDPRGYHSSVEYSTSFLAESAGSSTVSQNTCNQSSSIQQSSSSITTSFTAEGITRTSEFSAQEVTTSSRSYSTQVDQTRTTFQTKKSKQHEKEHLNTNVPTKEQIDQQAVEPVDGTDFVKELESVIEAGEKAIQELAQSLEITDFQNGNIQDSVKETEDWSSRREVETVQSLQAGGYQSGYTSVEGRNDIHLYPSGGSTLQEKTRDQSWKEAEDWSRRKEVETLQSLQTGGYPSGYTSVEGRNDVHLYPASESELPGKTTDKSGRVSKSLEKSELQTKTWGQFGKEADTGVVYGSPGAPAVGGDSLENVQETCLTEDYEDSSNSAAHNEAESTVKIIRGDTTEHTVVTNSAAFAMESPNALYRQEVHRTEVTAGRQTNEVSGSGSSSYISEVNKGVLDVSESGAELNKADSGTGLNTAESEAGLNKADNVTVATENKDTTKVIKVDNLERNGKYNLSVGARREKNAAVGKEDQLAARVVETEDIHKVLQVVNASLASDRAAHISEVNSKTQQAVETHPPVSATHKKDEDQANRSGAFSAAGQKAQLGQIGTEVIQATVASEQVNAQTDAGVAVSGGDHLTSDTVSVKETSKSKRKRSKAKSKNKEASAAKETSLIEEPLKSKETSRIDESRSKETSKNKMASVTKEASKIEELRSKDTSRIEESRSKETSRNKEAPVTKEISRNEESVSKETSKKEEKRSKNTSKIEKSRSKETSIIKESRSKETSRIEESRSKETFRIEETRSEEMSRIEEPSKHGESTSKEISRSKETSKTQEASDTKKMAVEKTVVFQANKHKQTASVTRKFNVSKTFEASLKTQGAILKSESISIAVYYDTPEFTLTLSDCWLRSVNSRWQLHSSFTKLLNELTKHEYAETEDKDVIISSLAALLKSPLLVDADSSIAVFVQKSGLREFARYTTVHKTYSLRGMTIQLELPEYGFWVGSVTVLESHRAELHEAVSVIDSFWKTTDDGAMLGYREIWESLSMATVTSKTS